MVESLIKEDQFLIQHTDYELREEVVYPNGGTSRFYDNGIDMVIIDNGVCNIGEKEAAFSYMLITDKQNHYMHQYRRVFRFLGYLRPEVDKYLESQDLSLVSDFTIRTNDRAELDSKVENENFYLLTLVAIAKELEIRGKNEANVVLAVGLPLTRFSAERTPFIDYLSKNRDVVFGFEQKLYKIHILNVLVYPQCYAAIAGIGPFSE